MARRTGGLLTDIPDPRDDRTADGPDYPEGQAQDPTLSRNATNSTYAVYPPLPGYEPPSAPAVTQTLNPPTAAGG